MGAFVCQPSAGQILMVRFTLTASLANVRCDPAMVAGVKEAHFPMVPFDEAYDLCLHAHAYPSPSGALIEAHAVG